MRSGSDLAASLLTWKPGKLRVLSENMYSIELGRGDAVFQRNEQATVIVYLIDGELGWFVDDMESEQIGVSEVCEPGFKGRRLATHVLQDHGLERGQVFYAIISDSDPEILVDFEVIGYQSV